MEIFIKVCLPYCNELSNELKSFAFKKMKDVD